MPKNPKPCPVCRAPSSVEHAPFCSRGCKDRDLLKWLDEGYRLPGPAAPPEWPDSEGLDSDGGDR